MCRPCLACLGAITGRGLASHLFIAIKQKEASGRKSIAALPAPDGGANGRPGCLGLAPIGVKVSNAM